MAKRQSRKSVSFRAEVFAALDQHCKVLGESVAAFVEDAVRNKLAVYGTKVPSREAALEYLATRPKSRPGPKPAPALPPTASGIHSW